MSSDLRIGGEFAGYRIESILGRGGMGVVYLAEDTRLGRKVALKVLPEDLARDQAFRDRFIRESRTAARLEHPNVVPVYEAGEAGGQLFIAMRYIRGPDLGTVLDREGALAPDRAVRIVTDVAAALDEAHAEGLVHRDVKPANILLAPGRGPDAPERALLADFGVTRRTASHSGLTQTGHFLGTADYAAPEQVEGKDVDARADVYALGCVLYHGLTGERPFVRDSDAATMYAHLRDRPPKPSQRRPDLPAAFDDVVATAMAKSPADRYPTAGDFAGAANAALTAEPVLAGGARSRRRWGLLLLVGAVVVAIAVTALALTRPGGRTPQTAESPSGVARVPGLLRIDPQTARVSGSTNVRVTPGTASVASGQGILWVLERFGLRKVNASGTVIGDPIDVGRAVGCTLLGGLGCTATIAAGEGSAWVLATSHDQPGSGEGDSHLAKVNPQTNAVESFTLRNLAPGGAFGSVPVAVGEGWVWSADRNPPSLLRIDPKDPRRVDRFRLAAPGDGLGVGFSSVWVRHNSGIQSFVSRVDPDTGGVIATIHVPGSADGIAFGGGNVWISDSTGDELIRVDPVTNTIAAHFPVGKDPQAVAVDEEGTVWVNLTGEGTTTDAGELAKVEPTTGAVVGTVPLPGSGGLSGIPTRRMNVVFAFGSIWVA